MPKQPLMTWFYAAYLTSTLTPGISAVQLQRQLGLKRYETAFVLLHKLRSAMVNPEREGLHGEVEMDETFIGGAQPGAKGGRSTEQKTLVVGAVERIPNVNVMRGFRAGRIRLCAIPDASGPTLLDFTREHVMRGARIITDGRSGYIGLRAAGYDHYPFVVGDPKQAANVLPMIHLEFSNLKTWLQGTYHARQERQHLQAYLNEFAFRHNRRFWRFTAFQTVLRVGLGTEPLTYAALYNTDEFGRSVHVCAFGDEGECLG